MNARTSVYCKHRAKRMFFGFLRKKLIRKNAMRNANGKEVQSPHTVRVVAAATAGCEMSTESFTDAMALVLDSYVCCDGDVVQPNGIQLNCSH